MTEEDSSIDGRLPRAVPIRQDAQVRFPELSLQLPDWIGPFLPETEYHLPDHDRRMRLVVDLARRNVEHRTGGPFGAAVFEMATGRLIAVGVNRVEPLHCSLAHAEMMALAWAQRLLGTYDLGECGGQTYELVTSTEPCAMCLGAIAWSGVRRVVCGATEQDARAIGFDEGDKPADWVAGLEARGISVVRRVLWDEARAVLRQYRQSGGAIYNPHPPPKNHKPDAVAQGQGECDSKGRLPLTASETEMPNYLIADLNDLEPVGCLCGLSRRAFGQPDNRAASVHLVEISADARVHYHKKLTEIYIVLDGEGVLELDGEPVPVGPLTAVLIRPGCRHRAVGRLRVLNVVIPPFDGRDEWFDDEPGE